MIKACVLCGVCISVFLTPVQAKEEVVQGVVQVQDDTGKPLEGAAFQLISYGEPLQELTSDKTGRIVLHDLDYGEYSSSRRRQIMAIRKQNSASALYMMEHRRRSKAGRL
ncbi:MAG: prealbumin-like fold domain-containing protein [[Clostridium] innocuum]